MTLDVHPIHDTGAANVNGFLGITKKFIGKLRESDEGNGEKDVKLRENGRTAENLSQFMDALYELAEEEKCRKCSISEQKEQILRKLTSAGFVVSRRGSEGGFRLARPASEVVIADVVRVMDGPLAPTRSDAATSDPACEPA